MITIQNLDVRFDVEGDDDKHTFARMFNECMRRWAAEAEAQKRDEQQSEKDRAIGRGGHR